MPLSEAIKRAIELATVIDEYWERELRKYYPKYPIIQPGEDEDGVPPPPEEQELRALFESLPTEDVYTLLALSELGRSFSDPRGLPDVKRSLKRRYSTTGLAVAELMSRASLADELINCLDVLRRARAEVTEALKTNGFDVDALLAVSV